jgi:hypothetical protein
MEGAKHFLISVLVVVAALYLYDNYLKTMLPKF